MTDESILEEASRIVAGDRRRAYGPAYDSFKRTGRMVGAYLHLDRDVTPEEIAGIFIIHKLSRESHNPKRDNRVDIIGYTLLLDEIVDRGERG